MTKASRTGFICAILAQRYPAAKPYAIASWVCKARQFSKMTERHDLRLCNGEYDPTENGLEKAEARIRGRAVALLEEATLANMRDLHLSWGNVVGASVFIPDRPGDGANDGWWL